MVHEKYLGLSRRVIIKLNILTSICSICEIRGRSVDEIDFETAQSSSYVRGKAPASIYVRTRTSLNKKSKIEKFYETIDQMKIAAHVHDDVVEIVIFIIFMLFQKRHVFSMYVWLQTLGSSTLSKAKICYIFEKVFLC